MISREFIDKNLVVKLSLENYPDVKVEYSVATDRHNPVRGMQYTSIFDLNKAKFSAADFVQWQIEQREKILDLFAKKSASEPEVIYT